MFAIALVEKYGNKKLAHDQPNPYKKRTQQTEQNVGLQSGQKDNNGGTDDKDDDYYRGKQKTIMGLCLHLTHKTFACYKK